MFKCLPLIGCSTNRQVEKLDKRHCSLNEIPDDVLRHGKTLEECFLDANHLQTLPKAFFRLGRLRKLGLSDNEIEHLPSDISNLTSLQELDLSKNDIQELPEEIKYLKSLYFLDSSSNPLQGLPEGISQLSSLTTLCLNDVSLTSLPHEFGNLSNLQALELRDNLVKSLPPSFSRLNNLLSLDLGNNEMEEFPFIICDLRSLEVLLLDCNEIIRIPTQLGRVQSLATIDFSDNHIEVLPDEIGNLSNLTDLLLSQNCLEQIPATIGRLAHLSILKVDHNRIGDIPESIGGCIRLTEIVLVENFLADLPETIGNLRELTILNVDKNSLTELPATVCQCRNLTILSLRKNRLQSLPMEIGLLDRLTVLDVSGNLIPHLPSSISQLNSLKAIWLSENQSQAMPKFQTDVDPETGDDVLTCFLLPQQDAEPNFQPTLENLRNEKSERLASVQDVSLNIRNSTRVAFSGVETDSEGEQEPNPNYFTRHDTPHPKEFKTRHAQLFKNKKPHGDGTRPLDDVAMHQEKEHSKPSTPEPGHNDHQHSTEVTQVRNIENISDQFDKDDRRSPVMEVRRGSEFVIQRLIEEPVARVGFSLPLQNNEDPRPKLQPRSPTIEWPVKKTEVPPPLPPRTVVPSEQSGSVQVQSVHVLEYDPPPLKKRRGSASSSVDNSMSSDEYAEDSDVDEQVDGQRKRVGFAESGDERKDKCSLTRRNTPHYNRGRRVITEGETAEEAKRKVADIMTRRMERGSESSPLSDQENNRPGSGTLTSADRFSYTNASTVSPFESPLLQNGTTVIQKTNYIVQGSNQYEVDSDTGSGPIETTVVKTFERSPKVADKPLKLLPVIEPVNRKSPEQVVKETVTQTTTTRSRPDSTPFAPMLPPRSSTPLAGSLPGSPVITIALRRSEYGLGLSIAGGKGSGAPYRETDEGIFISKITDGGPAQQAGLFVGDKVLTVNGFSVVDLGHHETVELLKNAGSTLIMMVQRDRETYAHPTSPRRELSVPAIPTHIDRMTKKQIVFVTLPKGRAGLGFSIAGGKGTAPYKDNDESIFISKIAPGGTADRSGSLSIGDKILSINGTNIETAKHSEAVKLLTAPGQDISLEVERDIPLSYITPNVDPRTGKRFSYFVEPNRVNTMSTLRPSQSADFLTQVGNGLTTLPSSWRPRNGYADQHPVGKVTERVSESEKIIHGVPSRNGSSHELNIAPPLKPRTKSVDGATLVTIQPKTMVSTGVLTDRPLSPAKVNRKLQVNTIEQPKKEQPPRLVTRSSQSDLVELVMKAEKEPPVPFLSQTSFSTKTVTQTVDSSSRGKTHASPESKRAYSTSSYTSTTAEPSPKYSSVRNELPTYPEPASPKRTASPSILRSSLRKESQQAFQPYKEDHVIVHTDGGALGLSIVGGGDYWCAPFGTGSDDTGIFISKLIPGGAAALTGLLRIGDRILRVNGRDVTNVLHGNAVDALRSNPNKTELVVRHDPPPEGLQELVVFKRTGETLGMNIRGGHKADVPGNPLNLKDDGIFISRILPDGAAARDGRLKAGMRILEVNGESVLGCSHEDAVNALRQTTDRLYIMVCDGFNPDQAEALMATNVAIQHLSEVSPADAQALRMRAQVQQKSQPEKTTEQLHEEMVKLHMEDALKRSAESEVQKLQTSQRLREEEQASEARRRQVENRSWTKAPVLQHQSSVEDFIKQEEHKLAEQQRKREEERRVREQQSWNEEMEQRRRERLADEDRIRRRREDEEKRIKAEIQEKLEADRRKRDELLRQARQRTPSAHSTGTVPPSPPPPLSAGYSSTTTMTTRTYSYNSSVEKKDGGFPEPFQNNGKGEKSIPPPLNVAFSSSSNGDKPPITPRSTVPRQQARGPLAAMTVDNTLKSPSAFTFKEKQMYFAKEIENQPDDVQRPYPDRRDPSPPSRLDFQTSKMGSGRGRISPDYDQRYNYQPENIGLPVVDSLRRNEYLPPYRPRVPSTDRMSWNTGDTYHDRQSRQEEPPRNPTKYSLPNAYSNPDYDVPEHLISEISRNEGDRERTAALPVDGSKPVRTAKAERRSFERQYREGSGDSFPTVTKVSPARERSGDAEKRAAWRADRLKSLDADTFHAQKILKEIEELSRSENRDSGFSAPSLEPTPDSEYGEFPRVSLSEEIGEPRTKERSRLVDEKVHRKLEEHIDPDTGKKFLTTTETVEQTVEHETETSKKKIIRLSVDDESKRHENGQSDF